ncbi:MAG TPA: uroporphyrinogen-III synthase [Gemmatimonadota bacterium]|nr:uroporphyrinogen-III synthase [Gemmatimonadota bacterium]
MSSGWQVSGRRVLVTASDPDRLCALLRARGASPVAVPTIAIRPLAGETLDDALARIAAYDWVIVTSANGVAAAFDRLRALGLDVPAGPRWAAVGPATRASLEAEGVRVDTVPQEGSGAAIPGGMGSLRGGRILLLRARAAGRDLPRLLRARGAELDDIPAYETVEGPESSRAPLHAALDAGIDAVVFTSGSTVRGLVRLVADPVGALTGARVVAIGPVTARAVLAAGLGPARVARDRTPEGVLAALEEVDLALA